MASSPDFNTRFQSALAPSVTALLAHPIYASVNSLPRLRIFMKEHVFAVWDFMSLLKRLQRDFCGTQLPWQPPAHADLARFINDIVLAEESDIDGAGGYTSHFDLYLAAMQEIDADVRPIKTLLTRLRAGVSAMQALTDLPINSETKDFVRFNLTLAEQGTTWEVAAAFCYGREDIIPAMFTKLLAPLAEQKLSSERFEYYLQRHVELDGDTHGPLARKMVSLLASGEPQREIEAQTAGRNAIEMRMKLWDGVMKNL